MSSVVAIVKSIVGQVIAVSPEGIRRVLIEGDRLFAGEQALTGPEGAVTLELADGRSIDLGRDTQWSADAPDSATNLAEATAQAAPSVAELQQAIAAGADPTQDFEAAAAGPTPAGAGGGAAGGGHSFVVLDATAGVVNPTIGFPTAGIGFSTLSTTQNAGAVDTSAPLRASTLTVTATPTLTEAGGTLVYTATVTQAPLTDLTITLSNGQTIVIAGGQTTGSSSLQIQDHNTPYIDPSQISTTVTGTTGGGGLVLTIDPTPAVTQITDTIDKTAVTLTASDTVAEGGSINYTVSVANAPKTDLVLTLSNGDQVTIKANATSATFTVAAPADDVYKDAGPTTLSVTGVADGKDGQLEGLDLSKASATVNVTDTINTTAVTLTADSSVAEGGSINYTVSVANAPKTDLVLTLSNGDNVTIKANATSATFTVAAPADDVYKDAGPTTLKVTGIADGQDGQLEA
ncbi:retention module-containing protein, partial [Pseudomonas sp. RTB2]|uniref:retention module-containing protein n=1 Tax=Pseudomonas sp. RTB2 TaxID=3048632 RepID=UPI002B2384E6